MRVRLYVIMGSHACRSAILMLDHKGVPFELVQLPAGLHPTGLALAGFSGLADAERKIDGSKRRVVAFSDRLGTVPALRYGDERVMTNHDIARFLERREPQPPLFPADPALRKRVDGAEAWADDILQMSARRLILAAGVAGKLVGDGDDGYLGPLLFANAHVRRVAGRVFSRVFATGPNSEPQLMDESRAQLDRVDELIGQGTLDGEELNVADFVVAPSVALLAYHRKLAAEIEDRPAGRMLERVFATGPSRPASLERTA